MQMFGALAHNAHGALDAGTVVNATSFTKCSAMRRSSTIRTTTSLWYYDGGLGDRDPDRDCDGFAGSLTVDDFHVIPGFSAGPT